MPFQIVPESLNFYDIYEPEVGAIYDQIEQTVHDFTADIHNRCFPQSDGQFQLRQVDILPPQETECDLLASAPITTREVQEIAVARFREHHLGFVALGSQTSVDLPANQPTRTVTAWHFKTYKHQQITVLETRSHRSPHPENTGLQLALANYVPDFVPGSLLRTAKYFLATRRKQRAIAALWRNASSDE